jgi:hypothetical protein
MAVASPAIAEFKLLGEAPRISGMDQAESTTYFAACGGVVESNWQQHLVAGMGQGIGRESGAGAGSE